LSGSTATAIAAGTARVVASAGAFADTVSITVAGGVLSITTSSLPTGVTNTAYSATLAASGGSGGYAWAVIVGSLPPGLSLNAASGAISGSPSTPGSYGFTVRVTSGNAQTAQRALSISVTQPGLSQVVGIVLDAVTSEVLAAATVSLSGGNLFLETTTAANGSYRFPSIPAGSYTLQAVADGYVENTVPSLDVVVGAGVVRADFALPPVGSLQRFAGVSGRVVDAQGNPIAGAAVGISGGAQTNGVFESTTTDADGTYGLVGIVLDDTGGDPILQFTVFASAVGFTVGQAPATWVQNETATNLDFALSQSQGAQVYYSDNFETGLSWQAGGLWNRSTLSGLRNQAVPTYVSLAPGDGSNGALPAPMQGAYALWYGQPSTGNFMGAQVPGDPPGSGGTSVTPNQGAVRSPAFLIPGNAPTATLRFDTWFEIESVNPNAQGFDIMTISVFDEGTGVLTELARLNPFVDPTFEPRDAIPFTSGGFNAAPVWRPEFIDLSAYLGKSISLVFVFSTQDGLYNGFRGWLIDNVSVSDVAVPFGAPPRSPAPTSGSPPGTRATR
jgi:hypothetical protein